MNDNNETESARALLDCNGEVWALARSGDDEYSNRYRFNRTRAELEENFGPVTELWPRETPEPEPEMVTATYPGDDWERMREVAAMDGATGRYEWHGAVTTGPTSVRSGGGIFLGDSFGFHRGNSGTLTVTAPKPVEPARPEWADALVVRVADGGVWARSGDGLWVEAGMPAELIEDIYNSAEIAAVGPVTVIVDADGQVVR